MRRTHPHRLQAALLAGLALLTAAAMTQSAQPAAAAPSTTATSERWLPVPLGSHSFGHLQAPDTTVATARSDQVGFYQPQEGAQGGPWSFDLPRDGSIWLSDQENSQLLVWQPGQPTRPARSIKLSDPAHIFDFAVAPDGTIYVTSADKTQPVPGMDYNLSLAALSPTGQVRWKGPTIMAYANAQLRFGPDDALYWAGVSGGSWTQLTTPSGRLLTIAEQRQHVSPGQPLSGGRQLVTTWVSDHESRVTLVNQAGRVMRGWRITSQNDLGGIVATPALVGGDPVIVTEIAQQTKAKFMWEFLVLRLAANGGTRTRFSLDPKAAWGDPPITGLRVGRDGQLYQLRSNPAWGVRIARYSLAPKPTPPPTTTPGQGPVPPSTLTPPPPSHAPTPTVTPPTSPPVQPTVPPAVPAQPASRSVLPRAMAITVPALLAAIGGWWSYRRRHPAGSRRHGRPHPVH